ncbi:MAG: DNA-directed RNA polymerase subunit beta' [Metamycoplasmataceae bacterium]
MPLTRKYAQIDQNKYDKISLSLLRPEEVLDMSNGEVTKPETINYKSFKPEPGGLFDELIFGPVVDYKCPICSKKYKKGNEGFFCEATEECKIKKAEILPKISRRSRMGHIKLNSPVVHFWFFKVDNSIISKLLALKIEGTNKSLAKSSIESIIYYKSHIVLESGGLKSLPKNSIIEINNAAPIYRDALEEIREKFEPSSAEYKEISEVIVELEEKANSKMGKDYGIDFYELNEIIEEFSDARIDTGSKAFKYLLSNINLEEERDKVKEEIKILTMEINNDIKTNSSKVQSREKLYKRLKIINSFIESGQKPEHMLIYNLPIIPADLRPLIQLDGGRHSTSDINELYRRIIIRNNRLKKWLDSEAPILIIQNELRMIQEAVDAVIDNARKTPTPVLSKDNRPLKSISDALTGKKGRFRQNLLGKRVDYSGRSVIVVGPELKIHQAGIPREMAAKLFEPWIVRELMEKEIATSIKGAKKLIDSLDLKIWPHVAKVIQDKPILLNRAPTLHRLSIQAFEPVLVRGRAIRLHPLVTTPFNADFDGDQMAVHVPISKKAIQEAKELIFANKNILGPKDGEPIINPSQDMILGIYYISIEEKNALGQGKYFHTFNDMYLAYQNKEVSLHALVAMPISEAKDIKIIGKNYIISSVGKFILNNVLPRTFKFLFNNQSLNLNENDEKYYASYGENIQEKIVHLTEQGINNAFSKKDIAKIVRNIFSSYVSEVPIREVTKIVEVINSENFLDLEKEIMELKTFSGSKISSLHAKILKEIISEEFTTLNREIINSNEGIERALEINERMRLLNSIWFRYTNLVANVLDRIKELGFQYSTKSGITISFSDVIEAENKIEKIQEGDLYVNQLKQYFEEGKISDDEKYTLSIKKWTEIKEDIQDNLATVFKKEIHVNNPINMMINSGARGNISNLVQLAGIRGLMVNNTKQLKADAENERVVRSTVEIPVKSSFLNGLTAYEFYSSTHGARKGLTDTALNTAKSGYLTRRLVDVAQNIVVREEDCGSDYGYIAKKIIDTKQGTTIIDLEERIEGRFSNEPIFDKKSNLIIDANQLITQEIAAKIVSEGIDEVPIRSILGCHTSNGVCKKCYGKDLSTNRVVNIGEPVGIVAAQSIGEPGTQLTMRTFHTGGVAGVEDITGGFTRLIELIDAYEKPWGRPAVIATKEGVITAIINSPEKPNIKIVKLEFVSHDGRVKYKDYEISATTRLRVKPGDKVYPGNKITDGPIILKELLKYTSARRVQNYLIKEIQRLYRMQGISIADKYIEIIVSQMLSKISIQDPGDSDFFVGSLVDVLTYQKENAKLLMKNQKPAFGELIIKGAKQTPLLSDSFLAAASYQETAKILVHAAISNQLDNLDGLKENIILGHKIPAGTASNYEINSKFDIPDAEELFKPSSSKIEFEK